MRYQVGVLVTDGKKDGIIRRVPAYAPDIFLVLWRDGRLQPYFKKGVNSIPHDLKERQNNDT